MGLGAWFYFGLVIEFAFLIGGIVLITPWGDDLYNTILFWFDREWQALKMRAQCFWYRRKAGRCLKCGYDLIHNTSGTCPECGTPIGQDRCTDV